MNLYGFTEEEAERVLANKRCWLNERKNPKRIAEFKAREERLGHLRRAIQGKDEWQMCAYPLAAKIAEESYDLSKLWAEDSLFEVIAEWLLDDRECWESQHEDELEAERREQGWAMAMDLAIERWREERDYESA